MEAYANDRVIAHIRGKQLGGSSAMNFMFWTHASQNDIDGWGRLGNHGWSWSELDPYFKKSEAYVAPSEQVQEDLQTNYVRQGLHGVSGPIANTFPQIYGPFDEAWPRTYQALGLAVDGDPRDGLAVGGYTNLVNVNATTHERSYAANTHYAQAKMRVNLDVITGVLVDKITWQHRSSGLCATQVLYSRSNQTYTATVSKEVILSAGTFGSPAILERSGVGSPDLLRQLGIETVIENTAVGDNLQDHIYVPIGFAANPGVPTNEDFYNETFFEQAYASYLANHTGPLSSVSGSSALLSLAQIGSSVFDLLGSHTDKYQLQQQNRGLSAQYNLLLEYLNTDAIAQELTIAGGMSPEYANDTTKLFAVTSPGHFFTLLGVLEHPFSRGTVHLVSPDPAVPPAIDPRYLSHPLDLALLRTIALHLKTIATTKPLSSLLQGDGTVYQPGYYPLTEENVADWIRQSAQSEYHPAGTCAMLPRELGGVVDEKLRLYGAENVRVVDASVFPLLPRANIQSLVYAVAERAAEFIKEEW